MEYIFVIKKMSKCQIELYKFYQSDILISHETLLKSQWEDVAHREELE